MAVNVLRNWLRPPAGTKGNSGKKPPANPIKA